MTGWNLLCLRLKNGMASPVAKTKREVSAKEARRLLRKFRKDDDFLGEWVLPSRRLGLNETELKRLPTI